jgi:hypothetical protein
MEYTFHLFLVHYHCSTLPEFGSTFLIWFPQLYLTLRKYRQFLSTLLSSYKRVFSGMRLPVPRCVACRSWVPVSTLAFLFVSTTHAQKRLKQNPLFHSDHEPVASNSQPRTPHL